MTNTILQGVTPSRRAMLLGAAGALAAPGLLRAQPAPIKVGILQPVTGALAQDGEYGRLGAELAIQELNATGGIKSIGGAQIQMVFGDARSNPEGGTAEVERMEELARKRSARAAYNRQAGPQTLLAALERQAG